MKLAIALVVFFIAHVAQAQITKFPDWVTDEKLKILAVDELDSFMKTEGPYQIEAISVDRFTQQETESAWTDITFRTSECLRLMSVLSRANLCDSNRCEVEFGVSYCQHHR